MPETRELRSVIDAAEQAAAAGDYASAEQLLSEAVLSQETSLGPLHPDLANTLNNLGVVCEILEKPVDAERYFRRASIIAATVLEPDHPFVATSRKNLEDFCKARGVTVDVATPPPALTPEQDAPTVRSAEPQSEYSPSERSRSAKSTDWSRAVKTGTLIAGGLVVIFIAAITWFRSSDAVETSPERASPRESSATTVGLPADRPIHSDVAEEASDSSPVASGPQTADAPTGPQAGQASSMPAAAKNRTTTPSDLQLVASPHLCRTLSTGGSAGDWQCVAPSLPVEPGSLFFYTRVKSRTDTTVEHRWYSGNRLHQVVELPIRANASSGYRTYSRTTVNDQDATEWRVELRTNDGVLLHEERFVVR
jgi:hypothetical protein